MSLSVTRKARKELELDPRRFGRSGRVSIPSFAYAYALADALRGRQGAAGKAVAPVGGEDLAALDLLEDLTEEAIDTVLAEQDPEFVDRCLKRFAERLGDEGAAARWEALADQLEVEETTSVDAGETPKIARQRACARQLLAATVMRRHPLADRILGLLGLEVSADPELEDTVEQIDEILSSERATSLGPLEAELEALAAADPDSFEDLLNALLLKGAYWSEETRRRLDTVLGLLKEARTPRAAPGYSPPGIGLETGPAAYSIDEPWMPELVMVAKNVLVWLHQLSERSGESIKRLDEIPITELERIAERGFTAIWLIGVWERSPASGSLKRDQGPEGAAASAYAVRRYQIADELGGDEALEVLKRRAGRAGLRLAADLVPNHTAIDSDWVIEHPERFISLPESPFPGYSFEGEDLSPDARVALRVEDHYRDRTDAAVVFQWVDRLSGETRYIYHGNDGTAVPWNDTAQLDYSRADTRAAVIEEIVSAARRFPILRFDAAMTLTRHHFHRLWFPEAQSAGAIPSRAEHGLSPEAFKERMPREFWREVVDRVAKEVPDSLLLAEAFWLMEAYFVRQLGLHRVYNSAFMHMLRDGKTARLRQLLQDAMEVDRAFLGRLTNYLSTPDEETTITQFGREARYFGACRVLVTMPGLPLFTHGQWEGLEEKYGMEFRRPQRDEAPDPDVVARHEREIAPLLARRSLFAGVESFRLLELLDSDGRPVDAVLAYANNAGSDTVIVAFNNGETPVTGRLVPATASGGGVDLWEAAWPGLLADAQEGSPGDGALELYDLTAQRRVLVTVEDRQAGEIRLELGSFECAVLGMAPADPTEAGQ